MALKSVAVACPRCGLQSATVRGDYQTSDPEVGNQSGWYYALSECPGCEHPFVTRHVWYYVGGAPGQAFGIDDQSVIYPNLAQLDEGVPSDVAAAFTETAKTVVSGSPVAIAMMCRRTLETICLNLGATEWNLSEKLRELKAANKLDPRLIEWAEAVVKELGDDAAHIRADITPEDARDAVEFTRALIHNVYVLQVALEKFKQRRPPKPPRPPKKPKPPKQLTAKQQPKGKQP